MLLGAALLNVDNKLDIGAFVNEFLNLTFIGNILDTTRAYKCWRCYPRYDWRLPC